MVNVSVIKTRFCLRVFPGAKIRVILQNAQLLRELVSRKLATTRIYITVAIDDLLLPAEESRQVGLCIGSNRDGSYAELSRK